jgi:hypothetical protein
MKVISLAALLAGASADCKTVNIGTSQDANPRNQKTDGHGRLFVKHEIEAKYLCPASVDVGEYKFAVRQMDSPFHETPGISTLNIRLDGVKKNTVPVWMTPLTFQCCTEKAEDVCQTVVIGSHWNSRDKGQGLSIDDDGWVRGKSVAVKEGYVCPTQVSKKNWLMDHARANHNGHAGSSAKFNTRMVDGKVEVQSVNGKHWATHLAFECCRPLSDKCHRIRIGDSEKAQPRMENNQHKRVYMKETPTVPSRYQCPAAVHIEGKTFRMRQNGIPGHPETKVTMRLEGPHAGEVPTWDRDIAFDCCVPEEPCQQVTIGSHWNGRDSFAGKTPAIKMDEEGWVTSMTVPIRDHLICPENVNKTNWLFDHAQVNHKGHGGWGGNFKTRMIDGGVQVKAPSGHWATHLAFNCCPPQMPTQFDFTNKCHPSKCTQWSDCNEWCDCFEPEVEAQGFYKFYGADDDGTTCDCRGDN